ncbi:6810_t:CDS:1, partial [Acaulospora colombiana]
MGTGGVFIVVVDEESKSREFLGDLLENIQRKRTVAVEDSLPDDGTNPFIESFLCLLTDEAEDLDSEVTDDGGEGF